MYSHVIFSELTEKLCKHFGWNNQSMCSLPLKNNIEIFMCHLANVKFEENLNTDKKNIDTGAIQVFSPTAIYLLYQCYDKNMYQRSFIYCRKKNTPIN